MTELLRQRRIAMNTQQKRNSFISGTYANDSSSSYKITVTEGNRFNQNGAYSAGNTFIPLKKVISVKQGDVLSIKFMNGAPLSSASSNCYFGLSLDQTQSGTVRVNREDFKPVQDVVYSNTASADWDFRYFFVRNRNANVSGGSQFEVLVYINGKRVV